MQGQAIGTVRAAPNGLHKETVLKAAARDIEMIAITLEVRPGIPQIDFKEEWADANT